MTLPASTVRNLELLTTVATGRAHGSLFHFLNRTGTGMGGRLLRSWLLAPLRDPPSIDARLDEVAALVPEPALRGAVRDDLDGVADVERVLTRLAGGSPSARDLNALARAVRALQKSAGRLADRPALAVAATVPGDLPEVASAIEGTFVEDPPAYTREGGMVRRGVDEELDRAVSMAEDGRRFIAEYEARERERTGIGTLKVRYNRVFGYTIEVTKSQQGRVPPDYERRQTLAGAERYTTRELCPTSSGRSRPPRSAHARSSPTCSSRSGSACSRRPRRSRTSRSASPASTWSRASPTSRTRTAGAARA